jgi:predicted O-methyltransferase YrrM
VTWRILKYIEHLFYRRYRNGHGIHSPYIFEFVNQVVFNRSKISVPDNISVLHRVMRKDCTMIPEENEKKSRSISSFVKKSSVSVKYGSLLYRIAQWFQPESALELGTGLGISAIYLASGASDATLFTIEGSKMRAMFAGQVIKRSELSNVQVINGDIDQEMDKILREGKIKGRNLAFVDGNHHYDPSLKYIRKLIDAAGEEGVIIMDDIYWSKGMQRAWRKVIEWPEVRVSIDLFHMGILVLRKDMAKEHLKIKF